MGNKDKLFNYLNSLTKPSIQPSKTIDDIKNEVQALQGDNAQKYEPLILLNFTESQIETESIFQKEIIGNESSTVANLIKKFSNSDWVKKGLEYLPTELDENGEPCPFCQQNTITKSVASDIKDYFDETYEKDLNTLKEHLTIYDESVKLITSKGTYKLNPFVLEQETDFDSKYNQAIKILKENKKQIEEKIKTPSQKITLDNSLTAIDSLNELIKSINKTIEDHNKKLDNKKESLNQITTSFWELMRWDYDQTISSYSTEKASSNKKLAVLTAGLKLIDDNITSQNDIILEQQKNTINIQKAIGNINDRLIDLGIDSFSIERHSDNLYKIVRDERESEIFHSLSEGEKMIISFLYFIELCKGKKNATEIGKKKIIVIDDPISSLSHIYIFNWSVN